MTAVELVCDVGMEKSVGTCADVASDKPNAIVKGMAPVTLVNSNIWQYVCFGVPLASGCSPSLTLSQSTFQKCIRDGEPRTFHYSSSDLQCNGVMVANLGRWARFFATILQVGIAGAAGRQRALTARLDLLELYIKGGLHIEPESAAAMPAALRLPPRTSLSPTPAAGSPFPRRDRTEEGLFFFGPTPLLNKLSPYSVQPRPWPRELTH